MIPKAVLAAIEQEIESHHQSIAELEKFRDSMTTPPVPSAPATANDTGKRGRYSAAQREAISKRMKAIHRKKKREAKKLAAAAAAGAAE